MLGWSVHPPHPKMSINRLSIGLLCLVLACGSDTAPGEPALKFSGVVANANTQAPIENATVITGSVEGTVYTPRVSVTTNAQGQFTIDDVCTNNDYIEARAAGYQTVTQTVPCAPQRRNVFVGLIPSP